MFCVSKSTERRTLPCSVAQARTVSSNAVARPALRRLHNNGVNGCVIDWVRRPDFYEKFGFSIYRRYLALKQELR